VVHTRDRGVIVRVLIVEDDRDHAESLADVLSMRGYAVEVAESGEIGVERFRAHNFDITLMDVKLPGMNGVETFFEFRKIKPDAKIIMMTGYSLEQLIAQALDNGALGVLRKPFAVNELLDMLERLRPRGMILVADDDPDFASSVEPVLTRHGYSVHVARTGQEALERADSCNCLVLDLRLPVFSGLEVYLQLKQAGRRIPIILVTGYADEERQALARLLPVTEGLLIKPFDPAKLLEAIEAALAPPPAS
jgi:DNA-binding response OmpR family regulator